MLRLAPILLALAYGLALYHFSAWRTARMLDRSSSPLADTALLAMTGRLARALGHAEVPVRIYEVAPVNGLAAPDGRIFLTRGFYDRYREGRVTAEEMASVIAHELGHVALNHSRRRMIDFSGQNAIRVALASVLGRFLPGGIGLWAASALMALMAARLSRKDEFEADEWASALLVKAGIGTGPQKSLFAKLGALTGSAGAPPQPAWLMSHPATAERIAAIEANERRWGLPVSSPG
ncbi:MAG: M48 family metallopeptidase [Defluviimonas sp.]|uniref:M48 family metallopeptidase n=1 Tax=Albidovulum sp. TaxID=1872424 RepID=UPI001DD0EE7C|nr:M48 family metallopeptidase [Paracoccaceae bacterium]MCC0064760.1 M48 family metallopeptidase [Defluviimonas sp.]